jgi:hypothetical protein
MTERLGKTHRIRLLGTDTFFKNRRPSLSVGVARELSAALWLHEQSFLFCFVDAVLENAVAQIMWKIF